MKRQTLNWILAIAVVLIWGMIAHELVSAVIEKEEAVDNHVISEEVGPSLPELYVYKDTPGDPFRRPRSSKKPSVPGNPTEKEAWIPPPLELVGIVAGLKRNTAIIESASGETHFVEEGESVEGVKLLRIERHRVIYLHDKRKGDWVLDVGVR